MSERRYGGRYLGLRLDTTLSSLPSTLPLAIDETTAAAPTADRCMFDNGNVGFSDPPTNVSVGDEVMYVCQRIYGCTEKDKRLNRYGWPRISPFFLISSSPSP